MQRKQRARGTAVPPILVVAGALLATHAVAFGGDAVRSIDGTGNNVANPTWGANGAQFLRLIPNAYADGISAPGGTDRPSARHISNVVVQQDGLIPNARAISDFVWQWGQFIDHDITLADVMHPLEPFDIEVPIGDPFFDPEGTGEALILLERSQHDPTTGTDPSNPREQMESITAFIDGSQVYGSDARRAAALRANDGTGRLATSAGNLLPYNTSGLPNFPDNTDAFFLAGDIRANEQIGLTSMHTLFVREHNRLVAVFAQLDPTLSGDELYELARAVVGAEIQVITYQEFLPLLLGEDAIPPYACYDETVHPGIANIFATAAYRVGHTFLSPLLRRINADGTEVDTGHTPLLEAFLSIDIVIDDGIEPILRGLASQRPQQVDAFVISDVRNFLFGPPGSGGFDLPALNMQRGREHGLPDYNTTRVAFGLAPITSFTEISSDPIVQSRFQAAYGDVDIVDPWIGGLAEDVVEGALVGEMLQAIIADQFIRLRDGDRFWYERQFSAQWVDWLESVRLSDIIRWNTDIDGEIQDDVFRVADCPGDVAMDGYVDVTDMLAVLAAFGTADEAADLNGDGTVDVSDLLDLLAGWGNCPGVF